MDIIQMGLLHLNVWTNGETALLLILEFLWKDGSIIQSNINMAIVHVFIVCITFCKWILWTVKKFL